MINNHFVASIRTVIGLKTLNKDGQTKGTNIFCFHCNYKQPLLLVLVFVRNGNGNGNGDVTRNKPSWLLCWWLSLPAIFFPVDLLAIWHLCQYYLVIIIIIIITRLFRITNVYPAFAIVQLHPPRHHIFNVSFRWWLFPSLALFWRYFGNTKKSWSLNVRLAMVIFYWLLYFYLSKVVLLFLLFNIKNTVFYVCCLCVCV